MKNILDLVLTRQSCRDYDGRDVPEKDVIKCIDTARYAPSGCNSQPWRFTVVTEPKKREKLAELLRIVGGNSFAVKAPVLVAISDIAKPRLFDVVSDKWGAKVFAQGDVGAATLILTMQAAELGIASCIMGTFDQDKVKELLDIPMDETVRVVVALGYAADPEVRQKKRKPIEELVRFVK
jgi:nitroreductase